ncbi:ATP-binding protein [Mesorhizobium sp. PUT5]|uniref:ATP-binding protein n=1 Tax=Mesorhizobium sp. PUT5 TaxID=3454629 RepID=UPI003FA458F0
MSVSGLYSVPIFQAVWSTRRFLTQRYSILSSAHGTPCRMVERFVLLRSDGNKIRRHSTRSNREHMCGFALRDNGCGMPEDVLRKVFDPFFTTKRETGTGIGLSQVFAFATMVGGQVNIASESGIGTTVTLLFPAVRPDISIPISDM